MNLYLDIDGVILTKTGERSENLTEFLKFATENFNCFWLTTHCKGNSETTLDHLKDKVSEEELEFLKKVKPTTWGLLKTEAINFDEPFLWLDDYVMEAERKILKEKDCESSVVLVDLKTNPCQLGESMAYLKQNLRF